MNYIKNGLIETLGGNNKNGKKLDGNKEYSATKKVQGIIRSIYKTLYKAALRAVARFLDFLVITWLSFYYIAEATVRNLTPPALTSLKSLRGKTILVTGGAGGVGQELVIRLVRYKAKVVVWDVNEKSLAKLNEKVAAEGFKLYPYTVDLSDRESVYKTAEKVKEELGPIDILINNAGVVCGQTFLELPDYMIERTYKVNTLSSYWTIKSFLPDMIKLGGGHIATVGSLTGLLGCYKCTDYSGSKYALIGLHESLNAELKANRISNIALTIVCPYFINSGMFDGCKPHHSPMLEPKDVAKRIILAIRREEDFCTVPGNAGYILGLKQYVPSKLSWLWQHRVLRLPQAMKSMRQFNELPAA